MKKKVLVIGALVCLLAILSAGTLAYFTDDVLVHNVITSDHIHIEIEEKTEDENGNLIDWPEETGITGVMPNTDVVKQVWVKNESGQKAWVRVQLLGEVRKQNGETAELSPEGDVVKYPIANDTDWKYEDGYYYYTKPLAAGAATSHLIDKVEFSPAMGNEYQNCTVLLSVEAQAVQYVNNEHGDDVLKVLGWPMPEAAN